MRKRNKGITLIALAVTIIVMLILAGVTIVILTGENGIIPKAKESGIENKEATIQEKIKLAYGTYVMELQINPNEDKNEIFNNQFIKYLPDGSKAVLKDDGSIYVIVDNNLFYIDNEGEVQKDNITFSGNEKGQYSFNNPIVPAGFYHVTGEWNSGFVISDSKSDENNVEGNNGNQFVWVPVTGEYKKILNGIGNTSDTNTWNTDNEIENAFGSNEKVELNQYMQILLYGGFYIGRYEAGIGGTENENKDIPLINTDNYNEYEIVSKAGVEPVSNVTYDAALKLANRFISTSNVQSSLITGEQWDTMIDWLKNSGFNVDGEGSKEYDVEKENFVGNYNDRNSILYTSGRYGINGVPMKWKTEQNVQKTSKIGFKVFLTGEYARLEDGKKSVTNNIFDLVGNVYEWTTETSNNENRIIRGGSAGTYSYQGTPKSRNGYYVKEGSTIKGNKSNWHVGFRTVLYFK